MKLRSETLRVTILGSGTSTGVPNIGCPCTVCQSPHEANRRTRCSAMLTLASGERIVIDTAPEFRLQMVREKVDRVGHVLYTHAHADHCHGFDDLRQFYFRYKKPVRCLIHESEEQNFRERFRYAFEDTGYTGTKPQVELAVFGDKPFSVLGLSIEPLRLPHGPYVTTGFRIGRLVYATDFKEFPSHLVERLKGRVKTMVASGVHFDPHPSHSNVQETLALFDALGVERGIVTHLGHEVDAVRDARRLTPRVLFAFDGMSFDAEI